MTRTTRLCILPLLGLLLFVPGLATKTSQAADTPEKKSMMLAHNVFFALKDSTPENRKKLVASCKKYLAGEPGTVFFAVGTASDLDREVNDRDFDVGLHVVFKDRASHDAYQTAANHLKFIAENKDGWKKVRVFDSDVEGK